MQWREDVGPARAGDAAARERLGEYFTPFAHGVALAHAPHHVTALLVPRILERAWASLGGVADEAVGGHVVVLARRLAKEAAAAGAVEAPTGQPSVQEARQLLTRLRAVPEGPRERLFLRLVEGVPGPELAQVLRVPEPELQGELERAATEAARALGQALSFTGDGYLWEMVGAPPAFLARLEMQLPVLRFDPSAAPLDEGRPEALPAKASDPAPRDSRPAMFTEDEGTVTNVAPAASPAPLRAPPPSVPRHPGGENPFEPQVATIAASDLPAEARGSLPAPERASATSGRFDQLEPVAARPVPAASQEGERSGKSGKSGRSGRSTRPEPPPQAPKLIEPTKEGPALGELDSPTEARVPAPLLARQPADVVTTPEGVTGLGMPTMQMPEGAAIASLRPPARALGEVRPDALVPPPPGQLLPSTALQGTHPLFLALILAAVGLAIYSASLLLIERDARAAWTLSQVVVAAEDMAIGETITLENVALRAVPDTFQGRGVVKADNMDFILDQRLAVAVQVGDPLFFSQLISLRKAGERMATKVPRRTRAVTVAASVVQSVGRWVRPGDLVDVIVSLKLERGAPRPKAGTQALRARGAVTAPAPAAPREDRRAVTLLQRVHVLATGKIADPLTEKTLDERDKSWGNVTLLLTPEEVEALHLAVQLGNLRLSLRNEEDLEEDRDLSHAYTDASTLLDGERRRLIEQKRRATITILRGAGAAPAPQGPGLKPR